MMELKNISLKYDDLQILKNFNISFQKNIINCIVGPSGVGKTTIANIIAQLIVPDEGKIIGLENISCSYVFQEPRLIDWYSIYDNIDFVLKDVYNAEKRKRIVNDYIDLVELSEYKDYKPSSLSGGMAQRVSIARAFAYPSDLLIMDEPFKALDIKLKNELLSSFIKLLSKRQRTVIFITHDINEAVYLSDTIYMLKYNPAKIVKIFKNVQESDKSMVEKNLKKMYFY
jgi:NitT/TauT family transport system ATP-binding protein